MRVIISQDITTKYEITGREAERIKEKHNIHANFPTPLRVIESKYGNIREAYIDANNYDIPLDVNILDECNECKNTHFNEYTGY